jgi:hypothetical protein
MLHRPAASRKGEEGRGMSEEGQRKREEGNGKTGYRRGAKVSALPLSFTFFL